ncbi:hypothetical protein K474DRAFT_1077655 [Panus rudis PR-1116 ss-1]|nr:hypothetical protein K474DRAFT_1077655 [Panus rudis PR-1116 ss-1]
MTCLQPRLEWKVSSHVYWPFSRMELTFLPWIFTSSMIPDCPSWIVRFGTDNGLVGDIVFWSLRPPRNQWGHRYLHLSNKSTVLDCLRTCMTWIAGIYSGYRSICCWFTLFMRPSRTRNVRRPTQFLSCRLSDVNFGHLLDSFQCISESRTVLPQEGPLSIPVPFRYLSNFCAILWFGPRRLESKEFERGENLGS